jgi:hypothetical protein
VLGACSGYARSSGTHFSDAPETLRESLACGVVRIALVLIALFVLTNSASAEVFVPADPPSRSKVECGNAAGDLVVVGDGNGGLDTQLVASVSDGPWRPLVGVDNCGALAVAPDGTAALVAPAVGPGVAMIVRRSVGTFGPPLLLGDSPETPAIAVAVASGGWAMALWETDRRDALGLMTVRPDGSVARSTISHLTDAPGGAGTYGQPKIALKPNGDATIVFAHYLGAKTRFSTARVVAGGAPVVGADLPGTPVGSFALDLASSPSGRSLVTWATKDGLRSMIDGGVAETVAPPAAVSWIGSSIADDGSAVIAYSDRKQRISAVDRAAGAAWSSPHVLAPAPTTLNTGNQPQAPLTAVAPGGQATVAWGARRGKMAAVSAASGRAGGAWAPATALSSPAWHAFPSAVTLTAAGVPRVFWIERDRGDALRAATLAPAKTDTTPPTVITRLPTRVAPTRTGRLAVTVRVRCSEACDARLSATAGKVNSGHVSRAITPGRVATLRLPNEPEFRRELRVRPHSRRVHLELLVTDRAGNLVRQRRSVRVRVA